MSDGLIRFFFSQRRKGAELLFDNALFCSESSAEYNFFDIKFLIFSAFFASLRLCERNLEAVCLEG
jgi:hypothetical protein